jgi:hypothetical protein
MTPIAVASLCCYNTYSVGGSAPTAANGGHEMRNIARTRVNGVTVTTTYNGVAYITQQIGGERDGTSSVSFDERGALSVHDRYVAAAR